MIVLIDHYGCGVNLAPIACALQRQAREHFAPIYGVTTDVGISPDIPTAASVIGLFKDADQPGALGYHDLAPNGLPYAKVFPELDKADGANISTTISHELLELLADPFLRLAVQGSDGHFWAYEACDAVEQDEYEIDGVKVSNFVTPAWYYGGSGKLDYLGLCTSPLQVRPGGYAQFFDSEWKQVGQMRPYRQAVKGRTAQRRR